MSFGAIGRVVLSISIQSTGSWMTGKSVVIVLLGMAERWMRLSHQKVNLSRMSSSLDLCRAASNFVSAPSLMSLHSVSSVNFFPRGASLQQGCDCARANCGLVWKLMSNSIPSQFMIVIAMRLRCLFHATD